MDSTIVYAVVSFSGEYEYYKENVLAVFYDLNEAFSFQYDLEYTYTEYKKLDVKYPYDCNHFLGDIYPERRSKIAFGWPDEEVDRAETEAKIIKEFLPNQVLDHTWFISDTYYKLEMIVPYDQKYKVIILPLGVQEKYTKFGNFSLEELSYVLCNPSSL